MSTDGTDRTSTEPDHGIRHETPVERLDRNWEDLLQELRVVQVGVQLLTGLLFTAAFQQRFTELTVDQRSVYLACVALSVLSTSALIAPVAMHRVLFRRRARHSLVAAAQRLTILGLTTLGLCMTGVIYLIFAFVAGSTAGAVAAALTAGAFCSLWAVIPLVFRARVSTDRR